MRLLGWFGFAFIGGDRLDLDRHAVLLVTELGLISFIRNLNKPQVLRLIINVNSFIILNAESNQCIVLSG